MSLFLCTEFGKFCVALLARNFIKKKLVRFQIASAFSKNMHGLAVYLTDWSTDNFCVDDRNVVTVVDLEHVVIVDQVQDQF